MIKQHKKLLLIVIALGLCLLVHGASTVGIADLYIEGDPAGLTGYKEGFDYSQYLFRQLPDTNTNGLYMYMLCSIVGSGNFSDWIVRNNTDAKVAAHLVNVDYLVYGTMNRNNRYLEVTLQVYRESKGDSIYTITHVSRNDDLKIFLNEVALKLDTVLDTQVFKEKKESRKVTVEKTVHRELLKKQFRAFKLTDYLGIYNGVGYYIPMLDWWDYVTGLTLVETGIQVVNLPPLFQREKITLGLRPALTFTYSLGINKPAYAPSYLHMFVFKAPLALTIEMFERYVITVNAGIQAQVDYFYQEYNAVSYSRSSAALSIMGGGGFEYWLGKKLLTCIGVKTTFDLGLYDQPYLDFNMQCYNIIRFKRK